MADDTNFTQNTTVVAIDIAKKSHDVLIRWPFGKRKTLKISNTLADYARLIVTAGDKYPIVAGFEPTADYHRNIAYWLSKQGVECRLVSSLASARARDMMFNSWDKNDRKDAAVIMYLLMHGMSSPYYDPLKNNTMDIQELSNTYYQISLARSRCYHSLLNHYLTLYFPEVEKYHHNSRSQWLYKLLLKYPTPQSIGKMNKAVFIEEAWDVVGRKVNKKQFLEEFYETAETSVGLPVDNDSVAVLTFKLQIQRYLDLTTQREQLENKADEFLSHRSDYHKLKSIPGIGSIVALIILAESGDLKRFRHYRQYINYCGFSLSTIQSGQSKGSSKLSKRGSARLRYAFWLAGNAAIKMQENSFRAKYQRYIKSDPDNADLKRKARTAVAVKVARVAHSLVKNDSEYRGYYEYECGT
jgi:transposase